jgi:hypothetical protein
MAETERHEGAITEPVEGQPLGPAGDSAETPPTPAAVTPHTDAAPERHEGAITEPVLSEPLGPGAVPDRGDATQT